MSETKRGAGQPIEPALHEQLSAAMRCETVELGYAYEQSSNYQARLTSALHDMAADNARFEGWAEAFAGGRQLAATAIGRCADSKYWRSDLGLLPPRLNRSLEESEYVATQYLFELLVWSRVGMERLPDITDPHRKPADKPLRQEFKATQHDLLNGDLSQASLRVDLSGATWSSIISTMLSRQIRVGPAAAAN